MTTNLFTGYDHAGFFDEMFAADGSVREHYLPVQRRLAEVSPTDLQDRERQRDGLFRSQGITFTVYGEGQGVERTFPMDLLPRVIPASEWDVVERGLKQRVLALNMFLTDLYEGEQAAINDGIVPRWLVTSASGFRREAMGVKVPLGAHCIVAGIDLVRDAEGTYRVLEDNLRVPSGISYVVENRAAMKRLLPRLFEQGRVRSVDHYGGLLRDALIEVAPPSASDSPCVVVLTPGTYNSAYFEHAFLARQMGVELVESRDLVVDDHVVYMRTSRGLKRVDVIYRRLDDDFVDPVHFRPDSMLGVPGLFSAVRAGTVNLANAIGNGVADDKAFYPYVSDLIRYYLNEEPGVENVPTYLLWDPEQRAAVLDRLDELVIKPVAEAGGYGLVIGPTATDAELAQAREDIEDDPRNWIAQEVVQLSRHPTLVDDTLEGRHIDLRPFIVTGAEPKVFPGGLTRVALKRGSLVVNSSQGGGSKDTWVLADEGNR